MSLSQKLVTTFIRRSYELIAIALFLILTAMEALSADAKIPLPGHSTMSVNRGPGGKMVSRIVTEEDNDRDIEIGVGELLRIDLRFQGGTGFSWHPDLVEKSKVEFIGNRTVDISEEGMVGGPLIGMWYFKPALPGTATLTMKHYRVWEGPGKAMKTFTVRLHVIERKR